MFGPTADAEPASPGSYGERPAGYRLPDATRLGPVRLQIADLARSIAYYERVLGLRVVAREPAGATLGTQGEERTLVELRERRDARPGGIGPHLGLYHFAILLPERAALGRFANHLERIGVRAGAADHLVSEALYLHDPDGHGIEVYADRPRSAWRRVGRELMIATDPLDAGELSRAAGGIPWTGMPAGTVIGHVHLHVGGLEEASRFFSDGLGFDRMTWRYPGALFFGAGGYHHHLGTNTWAGPSAKPPAADEVRLIEWAIELPDASSAENAAVSLGVQGYPVERAAGGDVIARDPWGTQVRLRVAGA